jgi:microcystin-dependent protein
MAYTILKSDGTVLTTIADGLLDGTTSLGLPGPNFVGYGQILNENLVYLLENFASNTTPVGYMPVSGVTVSGSQPVSAQDGNIWLNTGTLQVYVYGDNAWHLIGPVYTKSQGLSGAIPVTLVDQASVSINHNVLQLQFGNVVLATLSSDGAFVPATPITGFPHIYPGLTINESLIARSAQLYSNANTAAYLPSDPTIQSIQANASALSAALAGNVIALNAAITTANVGMLSYVNDQLNTVNSTMTNGLATAENLANLAVANAQSVLGSQISNLQTVIIAAIQANISAANAAIAQTNTDWTSNAANQQTQINTLVAGAYSNANVAAYLPAYNGNIAASAITATTPNWPPASAGIYDAQVATTTYVNSVLTRGMIVMWGGPIGNIPAGWQLCNGSNGTPDLRDRFVAGAGNSYGVSATGGATSVSLTTNNLPAHAHGFNASMTISGSTGSAQAQLSDPGHSHTIPYRPNTSSAGGGGFDVGYPQATGYRVAPATTGITDTGHSHTFSATGSVAGNTGTTGSGVAFNTLPPYYALCYIQKMY